MVETVVVGADGICFTVLRGTVGAVLDGEPVALGGPQQRRLLAALLAEHDTIVSADRLVESIWPEDAAPDGARRTAMSYVSRLRSAIGGDHLVTRDNGYELVLDGARYDATDFELALAAARASNADAAIAAYDTALAFWSGRAFGDDADEWWLRPVAARLEELRLLALEERGEHLIDAGRHADAVADLERLAAEQPLRERFVELLMRALYLGGRQAEALRVYRKFHDYLADETGLPPSDALSELDHRITLGDPTLAPSASVAVPGYELGELIGEGAFGAVYRAVQPSVGREVAIKVVRAELADDPRFVQRFEAEAQLVARLEHPHIVPLYDYWRRPGGAFLVFRLLRGGSLSERITEGPMPLADATRLVEEMSAALAAAHALGVVHRDVKPANVLFDEAGNSYLVDFGIAMLADADDEPDMRSAGSPMYASPEQARDGIATAASDQYALAVVMFEALTGRAPFSGTSTTQVLQAKLVTSVPSLADQSGVPDTLDAVLQRATAPHPDDRYPDVASFAQAWQIALADAGADAARTTGRLTESTTQRTTSATVTQMPTVGANPYKGLRAFREADAAEFYGRSELVDRLVATVDSEPFVTVVGPSGSGKSSVVHAGLVPAFRSRGALVVSMVPGTEPLVELESALRRVATAEDESSIAARLRSPGGLATVAADLVEPGEQLVLVVDQFEELWTLVESEPTRDRFAELLTHAATEQSALRVVVTLRADLYDRPLQHAGLGPIVSASTFAVTPMTAAELEVAIAAPAEHVGVRFEPGLVATMVGDVVSRPGALPLLQFALTELYERRAGATITAHEYAELGGIGGALATRAEQLYADMNADAKAGVRSLFTQLVTPGDDSDDLRRRATTEELASVAPAVIDRYLSNRLLVSDYHPITREPTIEVAHEALLREWPRLREWIDEDRDTIRVRRLISQTTAEWHDTERDESILYRGPRLAAADDAARRMPLTAPEQAFLAASHELADRERNVTEQRALAQARQNKRLRRLLVATVVVLVIALAFGVFAVNQRSAANTNARHANAARAEALTRSLASQAQGLLQAKHYDQALLVAAQAQQTAIKGGVNRAVAQLADTALFDTLTADTSIAGFFNGQSAIARYAQYSPNGAFLVSISGNNEVRAWDAVTHRELPPPRSQIGPTTFMDGVAVNSAGITASMNATCTGVELWDLHSNAPTAWKPPDFQRPNASTVPGFCSIAVSDGGLLAFAHGQGPSTVDIWDLAHRRRVGAPLTLPGRPVNVTFSPDGHRLAAMFDTDNTSLGVQLVDLPAATPGPMLVAQHGSFDMLIDPFQAAVVFSHDDRQVSVMASRGPSPQRAGAGFSSPNTTASAIETFDTRTGAQIPGPAVAVGKEFVGISRDLRVIAVQQGSTAQNTSVGFIDTRTGAQLAQLPVYGLAYTTPVAFDPSRPNAVTQAGPDTLTVTDWTQAGARHFATTSVAALSPVEVSAGGTTIDLTGALRALGLPDRCFAPLRSNCSYAGDARNYLPQNIPLRASDPRRPWAAAASTNGEVAILDGTEIAIWDPSSRRIERRLTGVPAKCDDVSQFGFVFGGTARGGSIVLGCPPSLTAWNLDSPGSTPAWHQSWPGMSLNYSPTPIALSPNNAAVAVTVLGDAQLLDARSGRLLSSLPLKPPDNFTGEAFSPDGRTYAQLAWSGTLTLIDTRTGKLLHTITSSRGPIDDLGFVCSNCGASGAAPAVVFSPDGSQVAVWHDSIGMEVWDVATGASLAVLGGQSTQTFGTLSALRGTGTFDVLYRHRLTATYATANALGITDIHDLVRVVNGAPTTDYTSLLRTVTWSLRPSDWALAACSVVGRDLTRSEWNTLVSSTTPYERTCTPLLATSAN
jgi:serine/threonine protein kinase/WD40 repeat protein